MPAVSVVRQHCMLRGGGILDYEIDMPFESVIRWPDDPDGGKL